MFDFIGFGLCALAGVIAFLMGALGLYLPYTWGGTITKWDIFWSLVCMGVGAGFLYWLCTVVPFTITITQ